MSHVIIGTAGHIDHGKSSIVKALTGTDPDRLAEEQERGMTIDLGFAFLSEEIAFIDVPGHEKFIKNMVAGVSAVDMAMLVVAADDGVMPQTREHLDILSLLQVKSGLIVISKIDLVDDDFIQLVEQDILDAVRDSFLQNVPIFKVSAITGKGIQELREYLILTAGQIEARSDRGIFWLSVDRSFTIKGFGTVVTGSVLSGRIKTGENLELLPDQKIIKVRGLQSHGKSVMEIHPGERAALNLQNIGKEDIQRGDVLSTPDYFTPSSLFDVRLTLLKSAKKGLKHRTRVRTHIGTREIMARIKLLDMEQIAPGQSSLAQLQLEQPAVAFRRDPFVIRQYSPPVTIGGGIILDINPSAHRRDRQQVIERLLTLEQGDPLESLAQLILSQTYSPISRKELAKFSGYQEQETDNLLKQLQGQILSFGTGAKQAFLHILRYNQLKSRVHDILAEFHRKEPLKAGMSKAGLKGQLAEKLDERVFDKLLRELVAEGQIDEQPQWVKLSGHEIRLSKEEEALAGIVEERLRSNLFSPPSDRQLADDMKKSMAQTRRILGAMQGQGRILRAEGDIYFHSDAVKIASERLAQYSRKSDEMTVSEFREMLETTRKYAMGLLSHFDEVGITERIGDVRLINKEKLK